LPHEPKKTLGKKRVHRDSKPENKFKLDNDFNSDAEVSLETLLTPELQQTNPTLYMTSEGLHSKITHQRKKQKS